MLGESDVYSSSKTDCNIKSMSDNDTPSDDDAMQQMEEDSVTWLEYCRVTERIVGDYPRPNGARRYLFPTKRCGHIFMLQNIHVYPQTCFQEFRMYLPMFIHFTHILYEEYDLSSSANIDIYEQVEMFLCILAHTQRISISSNSFWLLAANYLLLFQGCPTNMSTIRSEHDKIISAVQRRRRSPLPKS